jgi:predicted Zn-dependent protease
MRLQRRLGIYLALLTVYGPACATNPATGKKQLMLVSEEQEIAMGREADGEVGGAYGLYPDQELQAYVERLGKGLAARSERPELPWSFRVVDDPVVNAFALPGGFIYVTRGILAHFESEAQLAAVLGHEIGHVTARHSADQMSRQQVAMLGLGVGMILQPELQRFAGAAQAGLGLMFLKFGRDHEREADSLGLRYMLAGGYAPGEMSGVFRMLDRAGSGGERLPDWLSTHPSPQDRLQRIEAAIPSPPPQGTVNRDSYLQRLDGLVFGENPREGFFRGREFLHPELRFHFVFPPGFKLQNRRDAVVGVSPRQDAAIAVTLAPGESPGVAARDFMSQQGVSSSGARRANLRGFDAVEVPFEAGDESGSVRGSAVFVADQGRVYRLLGYSVAGSWSEYAREVEDSLGSYRRLADRGALEAQPARLALVRPGSDMTVPEFAQRYPGATVETLALINQVAPDGTLRRGQLAKRVVAGRQPD